MKSVEFWWDVGSPYTYLASTQLKGLSERTGAVVHYVPMLLGGVFKATGNHRPVDVVPKARYMLSDLRRWAAEYGVPMALPGDAPFPINTLLPMRVAVAAAQRGHGEDFCHAVFEAYWVRAKDVSDPGMLEQVVRSIGLDPEEITVAAQEASVKDELRSNSDRAVLRGVFGAPTFFVGDEMFWGNDRLHQVEKALKG